MNLFDLFARITLDDEDYKKSLDDNEKKTSSFADKLKAGLSTAGKVAAAGLAAVGAAVAAVGKAAVENYADYEQLVGGVETLFKGSADAVQKYAEVAYKTAGLSANEYMTTVTSFSASLLQSLGGDTAAAADYADQAIIDMADNANKMGTSMESIQNAYNGFAKQNFTMLDNLKLGYGGTKEEMQRLLDDAGKIAGVKFDISSFADITQAIHVMQEEMGIAGATAAEAEGTISGSAAAMKAAWTNLVTGLANENANVDDLLNQFIASVETTVKNIIPVVKTVLVNLGETIEERGPDMLADGVLLLGKLALGLIEAVPGLIAKVPEIIRSVVDAFKERGDEFKDIGKNIVTGLWEGIKAMGSWIKEKVGGFFGGIIDSAKDMLGIHSPSRVFAEMGGFMAEGLGEGWDKQYRKVKGEIESGLHFGTASVDFADSGFNRAAQSAAIGFAEGRQGASALEGATFVVDLVLDGATLARKTYKFNQREGSLRGGSLVEVGV